MGLFSPDILSPQTFLDDVEECLWGWGQVSQRFFSFVMMIPQIFVRQRDSRWRTNIWGIILIHNGDVHFVYGDVHVT